MTDVTPSGGSRGRRLGQLPRAPREGHQRGESKNNANLHNEKHVNFETDKVNCKPSSDGPSLRGAQSGNLAQGTRNHRSASVPWQLRTVHWKLRIGFYVRIQKAAIIFENVKKSEATRLKVKIELYEAIILLTLTV